MEVIFHCQHCQQSVTAREELAGQDIVCPHCQRATPVPRRKLRLKTSATELPPPVTSSTKPCPHCGVPMAEDALLCIQCGWDSRTNARIKTSVSKRQYSRAIVAVVAVVVIAIASTSIWRQLHPSAPVARPGRRMPSSLQPREPVVVPTYRTTIFGTVKPVISGKAYTDDWTVVSSRLVADPAWNNNQPGVQVRIQLQASTDSVLPAMWPRAVAVELLRAESATGPFKPVITQGEADVRRPFQSSDIRTTVNGVEQPRCHYQYSFTDSHVATGHRYYYKLRFSDGREKLICETGYCSTVPLALPVVTTQTNPIAQLTWTAAVFSTNGLIFPPQHSIRLTDLHELQRGPLADGVLPLPPLLFGPLESCVSAVLRADEWDLKAGQLQFTRACQLKQPVKATGVRQLANTLALEHGQREAILCQTAADSGNALVTWQMPDHLRLLTLQTQGQRSGTQRWCRADQSIYNMGSYNRTVAPGISERVEFVYSWPETLTILHTNQAGPKGVSLTILREETSHIFTGRVELVRPPLPPALSIQPGDRQVTLSWPHLVYDPADWVDGPWLILRRYSSAGVTLAGEKLQFNFSEEIFRGPATNTVFVDHRVMNDTPYFYTLDIAGATRAKSWTQQRGLYECILPVDVRSEIAAQEAPRLAIAHAPHVLRLAFAADPSGWSAPDPRANVLQAHCLRTLRHTPWIEVLDRTLSPTLLREHQVAGLQTDNPHPAAAADAILSWRIRQVQYDHYFDVWLEDFQRQSKTRLFSQPLANFDATEVGNRLLAALRDLFPAARQRTGNSTPPPTCSPVRTIAVTGFQPLSDVVLPAGGFDDLLVATLAQDDCLRVVERDQLADAIRELGTGPVTDQGTAINLGKMLQADAVLSGFYQIDGENVVLSARLLDAGTGQILNIFEMTGTRADLKALARRLSAKIVAAAKGQQPVADSPMLRWMEAQSYIRNPFNPIAPQTAAMVSPGSAEYLFNLGKQQQDRDDLEEALGSYRNGLNLAEKTEDPWRFYAALGSVLARLDRSEERVALWKRAVADRDRRHVDSAEALWELARSQRQAGHNDQAVATLDQIPPEKQSYAIGREYEAVGRTNIALAVYGKLAWKSSSPFNYSEPALGPGYAALVRLLDSQQPEIVIAALKQIVNKAGAQRPQQLQKAIHELTRLGANLDDLIPWLSPSRTLSVAAFEKVIRSRPESLEALQARMSLAAQARRNQDAIGARHYLEDIIASKVAGADADRLREMAGVWLRTPVQPPRPPVASPPDTNAPRVAITMVGTDQLMVDSSALIYRVNERAEIIWKFDPQSRAIPTIGPQPWLMMGGGQRRSYLYEAHQNSRRWYNMNYSFEAYLPDLQLLANAMLLDGATLYAPNLVDGTLTAIDVSTGQPRWTFVAWAPLTRPILLHGRLWVGDSLGWLHQLGVGDGKEVTVIRYPTDHLERSYCEQLFQLNIDEAANQISFINPRYTGNYRGPKGLQRLEFESHLVQLDGPTVAINDLSTIPLGLIPAHARIEKGIVRLNDPNIGKDTKTTTQTIQDKASRARADAIVQARNLPEREKAVPILLELLDDSKEAANLRASAIDSLSEICGTAFLPRLGHLADDSNAELRRAAIIGLGRLGNHSQIELLRRHLTDSDDAVREEAVASLVRLYGAQARTALADILSERSAALRPRLLLELVRAGEKSAIPLLKEAMPDGSYVKNDDVLVMLCRAGDPDGIAELQQRFDWTRATMAPAYAGVLVSTRLPEPRYGDFLRDVFDKSDQWGGRAEYAPGLAAMGDPLSIPTLIGALPGRSPGNAAIIMALEDLTGRSFGDNRIRWEQWWQTEAPVAIKAQTGKPATP